MKTLALICAYNEEATIGKIVTETVKYVNQVIVVDDGSSDRTRTEAQKHGATVLSHFKNSGKGQALKTGLKYFLESPFEGVITLDADGQHLPSEIPRFIESIKDYDFLIGKRDFDDSSVPFSRKLGNNLDSIILSKILKTQVHDPQNGFRMFRKSEGIERILRSVGNRGFTFEIESLIKIIRAGYRIGWVEISTIYEEERKSKIKPFKHVLDSIKLYLKCLFRSI
jgi:glycosyltransferase involved in cell wall biosynthesis